MTLPKSLLFLVAAALAAVSFSAQAEYIWLERDATGVARGYVGELDSGKQAPTGVIGPRAYLADGKEVPLSIVGDAFAVDVRADADVRMTANRVADKGALIIYQARYGRNETKAVNDLELVPTEPNGNTFRLFWKGTVVAASQVNVTTSAGWHRVLKPAKDGSVTLPTSFPGLYLMEVAARINGSATVDGKKYEDVRHIATLTFEVKN